ncbi:MAG: ABC transporter ATP-binding protein [Cryobacterium sp.]|nr:ABC transporter ATP-binding protein [Oligoflexia bacterium]
MGIVAKKVGKSFGSPASRVLSDISLEIADGEFVSLTGRSGAGKSTLLYILSTLDDPTEGIVEISGLNITKMNSEDLHHFRNQKMGFVFQFNYLIAELTAIQNVMMPTLKFQEQTKRRPHAEELMEKFGLKEKMDRYPRQLSGGEQQRVAIARALVMEPHYLFADEPTGSLDAANAQTVMSILTDCSVKQGMTVVMVTHDSGFAKMAQREIEIVDGKMIVDVEGKK